MQKLFLLAMIFTLAACNQNQIITPAAPSNPRGLIEINFSEISDAHPGSSAKNISSSLQNRSLSDVAGGIDMKLVSTTAFTFNAGVNREDGFRYLSATYKIRNADSAGTPYTTPRNNLSFIAVSTPNTVGGSAISRLLRFDGTPADSSIAPLIRPTHEMTLDSNTLTPKTLVGKEDFQAYLETEIAQFQPGGLRAITGVTSVFGYGFVTRTIGNPSSRILPATPVRTDGYDGIITFAVRVPLQANPNGASKDPFSFSMMFEVMDDSQTSLTQSLEEQADFSNVLSRSALLNNAPIKLLPGSSDGGVPICSVRTAGTVSNPLAFMVNSSKLSGTPALANQMFAAGNTINANFDQAMNAANNQTFTVNGSMTGIKLGTYGGAGTNNLSFVPFDTSSATFPPNEEVEVTLTRGLNSLSGQSFCPPYTFKYRSKVNVSSTATFPNVSSLTTGNSAVSVVSADLNHDNVTDLISVNQSDSITIFLGKGNALFQDGQIVNVGQNPTSVTVFDLNRDHDLDLVVTNKISNNLSVLLGNGTGKFISRTDIGFSEVNLYYPRGAAITDFNSDGKPDIITLNDIIVKFDVGSVGLNTYSVISISVFLGNGDGSFKPSIQTELPSGNNLTSINVNDLNNDGKMDVVIGGLSSTGEVLILLGNGEGRFKTQSTFVHASPRSAITSDVNNDKIMDLITADTSQAANEVSISLGNSDGSFQAPSFKPVASPPFQVIAADLNGDGKLDLATCNSGAQQITVLLGNGDGTFQDGYALPVNAQPNYLIASDLNGDGKLDLASTSSSPNTITLLLQ